MPDRPPPPPRRAVVGRRALFVAALIVLGACAPTAAPPAASSATSSAPPSATATIPAPTPSPTQPNIGPSGSSAPGPDPTAATVEAIATLTDQLRRDPEDAVAYRDLALALLQRARETADPSFYDRAQLALDEALRRAPDDPLALVASGSLQLARHRFSDALATGRRALATSPELAPAHGVVVDALVELGRYDEAVAAAQAMVDLRSDLASLARVSYLRELDGDLLGAVEAMEAAALSGAGTPEGDAYIATVLGDLLVQAGRSEDAAGSYARALRLYPDYAPARFAQGRLAAGRGDLTAAIEAFGDAARVLPLPEYVVALGEAHEVAGDEAAARDAYALARTEVELFRASGVIVDLELALFEADHGDPAVAVELARAAYAERRTIHTADALAWALHRAGRSDEARPLVAEALALGTQRALFRYHAGMIASAMGETETARRELELALRLDPGFSPTGVAAARQELARLAG